MNTMRVRKARYSRCKVGVLNTPTPVEALGLDKILQGGLLT
jgi:hypothetical protein